MRYTNDVKNVTYIAITCIFQLIEDITVAVVFCKWLKVAIEKYWYRILKIFYLKSIGDSKIDTWYKKDRQYSIQYSKSIVDTVLVDTNFSILTTLKMI